LAAASAQRASPRCWEGHRPVHEDRGGCSEQRRLTEMKSEVMRGWTSGSGASLLVHTRGGGGKRATVSSHMRAQMCCTERTRTAAAAVNDGISCRPRLDGTQSCSLSRCHFPSVLVRAETVPELAQRQRRARQAT
jgi:hypothetical protein